jgi:hypothetical protein
MGVIPVSPAIRQTPSSSRRAMASESMRRPGGHQRLSPVTAGWVVGAGPGGAVRRAAGRTRGSPGRCTAAGRPARSAAAPTRRKWGGSAGGSRRAPVPARQRRRHRHHGGPPAVAAAAPPGRSAHPGDIDDGRQRPAGRLRRRCRRAAGDKDRGGQRRGGAGPAAPPDGAGGAHCGGTVYDRSDGSGDAARLGLPPWPAALDLLDELNQALAGLAAAHGALLAGMHARFLGHGLAVGDPTQPAARPADRALWYCGLIEPNAWGASQIRAVFWKALKTAGHCRPPSPPRRPGLSGRWRRCALAWVAMHGGVGGPLPGCPTVFSGHSS